jgi:general secretion pathway protein G
MQTRSKRLGFTLIEVMVVVVILGVLAMLVVPKVMERPDEAKLMKVQHDFKAIETALNLYRLDNNVYPTTEEGLVTLTGKYLDSLPMDPWNHEYFYISPGEHGDFDIFSEGADGVAGGDGINQKLGNWDNDS